MRTLLQRAAAVCLGSCALGAAALALGTTGSGAASADGLRAQSASLEARAQAATLELYALETELARARQALADVAARRTAIAREQASTQRQLRVARQALRISETRLAEIVRALYEQDGAADPLAVLLGANSLEEALSGLENLDRAAGENDRILEQARRARGRLAQLDRSLNARAAELDRLAGEARERARRLGATASERRNLIAGLRRQQGLNAARIASIETQARAAEARSRAIQQAAPPLTTAAVAAPAPEEGAEPAAERAPVAVHDGTVTLTVEATGYALEGRTATGIPTAPGVVAVDPSVIPLGTRMTIPGYGTGIAADTGGAVQGSKIDLWFPTTEQALAWGRRTVTITLH